MQPRISRQGLAACPGCNNHIKVTADWTETRCPFCGLQLVDRLKPEQPGVLSALRGLFGGKGGAMATSLVSLGIMVGCTSGTVVPLYGIAPLPDATTHDASDAAENADAAGNADATPNADAAPLADSGAADAGATDAALADAGSESDASDAGLPIPLYGGPPLNDAAATDSGADGSTIVPAYGIAPVDGGL